MSATQTKDHLKVAVQLAGWREVASIPSLGIRNFIAKLDSGARTSALHATDIQPVVGSNNKRVRFRINDTHSDSLSSREVESDVVDIRLVRSSSGATTNRYVIREMIVIGDLHVPIQFTLSDRTTLRYPILVGRMGMNELGLHIDPRRSWRLTRRPG